MFPFEGNYNVSKHYFQIVCISVQVQNMFLYKLQLIYHKL